MRYASVMVAMVTEVQIDPEKLPQGQSLEQNINNVVKLANQLIDAIGKYVEKAPM
jgi:hypothetical protein